MVTTGIDLTNPTRRTPLKRILVMALTNMRKSGRTSSILGRRRYTHVRGTPRSLNYVISYLNT